MRSEAVIGSPAAGGSPEAAAPALLRRIAPAKGVLAALLTAFVIAGSWLIVAPRSPDLAAQAYREQMFLRFGWMIWDNNWYGGHHMPGYSLLYQPLGALLGMRTLGALAVLCSAGIFAVIATISFGPKTTPASVFFAAAACGDLWIGRLTFALGVTFALAAVLCLLRGRSRPLIVLAVLFSALSAASSPVAGLLLALAGATDVLARHRLRPGLLLILPVLIVLLPLEGLFPEGGFEPFPASSLLASLAVALAFLYAVPARERLLRVGGALFVAIDLLCLLPTPMGSNVVRYAVLLAGPLLLCAYARTPRRRPIAVSLACLAGIAFWVAWGPVTQTETVLNEPSTRASYYEPLERFLASLPAEPRRIEVPFTRAHWDAAYLALHNVLARGWERQLEKRFDEPVEADPLRPSIYRRWLDANAVSYVALPDAPLDGSSAGEARLIRQKPRFLREVFKSAHWRVFAVADPTPLAEGPGRLIGLTHEDFVLRAKRRGAFLVRVHYTPYWTVVDGAGSVREAHGDWTEVDVQRRGLVVVAPRFTLAGVLRLL